MIKIAMKRMLEMTTKMMAMRVLMMKMKTMIVMMMAMTMTVMVISIMMKIPIKRTGRWKGCLPMKRCFPGSQIDPEEKEMLPELFLVTL